MKATLTFNLPEDQVEFQMAVDASSWQNVAWEIDQYLRAETKYGDEKMSGETYEALAKARERLHEIMTEYNVQFI